MNQNIERISRILINNNIKPSFQRIKILEYLLENKKHPTVDEIYVSLHPEIPTLSKTTIYNTLNLFLESGIVRALNIESSESRYDPITDQHGHFKCDHCGSVYDFPVNFENIKSNKFLEGYEVKEKDVILKGICKHCKEN